MATRAQTPSQTVGPFFSIGLVPPGRAQNVLVTPNTPGEHIRIEGAVFDGAGQPVPDALIEIWQANANGRYRHGLDRGPAPLDPGFYGFGRCATDECGIFSFETIKPGAAETGGVSHQAPHVNVTVFARGMLVHAFTRMYFSDDPLDADPVLAALGPERRRTLIGERVSIPNGIAYRWDVRLQGEQETVFFDA